jgi:hypothetical protein
METLGNKKVLKSVNDINCYENTSQNITNNDDKIAGQEYLETNGNKKVLKSVNKYVCNICDYSTSIKQHFDKHILTRKHIAETLGNQKVSKSVYQCNNCNKIYKNRSGLWKHKQLCYINQDNVIDKSIIENNDKMINLVLELVKQNSEFKELLIDLSKDKIMNNCNNTTSNSHNTTNNNNHFNLNLFLNETCKNAMSITEFVEQIPLTINDLEDTARLGYVEGISKIFIKGLKELEVNERPIHCSDAKRETLYIKEGDIWEKDDSNKTRLTNAIRKVGHKNIRMIPEWKKKYPDCEDYYSKKNDLYLKIVNQSMCGGSEEETETNYNKIKKNIIKEVVIEK